MILVIGRPMRGGLLALARGARWNSAGGGQGTTLSRQAAVSHDLGDEGSVSRMADKARETDCLCRAPGLRGPRPPVGERGGSEVIG